MSGWLLALPFATSCTAPEPENLGASAVALVQCAPDAPFLPAVPAFTGSTFIDGISFTQDGLTAYLSGNTVGSDDIFVTSRAAATAPFGSLSLLAAMNSV